MQTPHESSAYKGNNLTLGGQAAEKSVAAVPIRPTRRGFNRPLTLQECFDPRCNSIGFLRWLMAFLVIFSHAGPIAGLYGGHDLGTHLFNGQQSLGGVAVAGFFFFSGYLITGSRIGRSTIWRYLWRRILRIMPAFYLALGLTAFGLAPIAWVHSGHNLRDYFSFGAESPWLYLLRNFDLTLRQRGLAGMGENLPYFAFSGARDWNGSAWTLRYEFGCYLLVGLLGIFAVLQVRRAALLVVGLVLGLNFCLWNNCLGVFQSHGLFLNPFWLMLLAPFMTGLLMQLYADKIPMDDRLAIFAALVSGGTLVTYGWNVIGQVVFGYFLMWLAIRLPLQNWEKYGDFSYGVYIFAWPIMTFLTFYNVQTHPKLYLLLVVVIVHILAFLSWHLVEKPAMSLKSWTPKWMLWLISVGRPVYERLAELIIDPRFSSSRWAAKRLEMETNSSVKGQARVLNRQSSALNMENSGLRPVSLNTSGYPQWVKSLRYLPLVLLTIFTVLWMAVGVVHKLGWL